MPVIDDDEIAYGRVAGMDISKRDVKVAVRTCQMDCVRGVASSV